MLLVVVVELFVDVVVGYAIVVGMLVWFCAIVSLEGAKSLFLIVY